MNEKKYRENIKSKLKLDLSTLKDDAMKEHLEVVVGTYSMTRNDWKKMNLFSYLMMIMHSFKQVFIL